MRERAMGDEQQQNQRDHWSELAEQLGLPPQPASAGENAPGRAENPRKEYTPEASARGPAAEESDLDQTGLHQNSADRETDNSDWPEQEAGPVGDLPGSVVRETPDATRPRGRDRAGRGGPRKSSGRQAGRERSGRSGNRRGSDEEPGRERAHRRSHRTKDRSQEDEAQRERPNNSADETEILPAGSPDIPEEEVDTLSDWNVPSWAELIASLYRPER